MLIDYIENFKFITRPKNRSFVELDFKIRIFYSYISMEFNILNMYEIDDSLRIEQYSLILIGIVSYIVLILLTVNKLKYI